LAGSLSLGEVRGYGLALNAVVLWNSLYIDATVKP
jgi:hypothetical protein